MLLDPGMDLTLRPMRYPVFFDMYKAALKNSWAVDEVDFSTDLADLDRRVTPAERHLIQRLVAFFATGDSIVGNNLVLNLYQHINSPEARMYLSRQLYEEAVHVQFYLTLLDNYLPDMAGREQAFAAINNIPSIKAKADFCFRWIDSIESLDRLETREHRRQFLLNLICFAACIEGLFFFGAFAYVYFLRSKGLLHGLATGTNWVFRDESAHIAFAFNVIATARREEPDLFDAGVEADVVAMMREAVDCEAAFAGDVLSLGVAGMSPQDLRKYLEYVADRRLESLDIEPIFGSRNPFAFMELQDVQELANFFERRVSAYQVGVTGDVVFGEEF
ncbi:MAG: ribonucleotide-diphosphate reductase subunit beta [Paludisphaera borealis]|uniref:ribonucleotide-diphosphate reductase subunit beta n=1 Tax=Paludisphaera borealis TaxID=1387353 RepID=UPI00284E2BB3|nr:ribonucleotide-diphosphate reductase subunit beta [Paludisphaera borealis]MDR3621132.1 ribonucleotide-diphosphate reductase subunit beta [Paludisphaera borealis]